MSKARIQFTLRLPKQLHDGLRRMAKETQRDEDGYKISVTRLVVGILKRAVVDHDFGKGKPA